MDKTWTWLRAWDANGTLAAIVVDLATDQDLADFSECYRGSIESYKRRVGYHWDGGSMGPSEIRTLYDRPYVKY
jgi:hypothetical protein